METWQTCTCCIQHGVVRKHKRWQGAAHFTRRSKLGPAVCDFTRNRRTQYAKYALSCDPKFTNQRLLGWMLMILQSAYVFFLKKTNGIPLQYNIECNMFQQKNRSGQNLGWRMPSERRYIILLLWCQTCFLYKDFKTHATACDQLLQHYTQQFRDREMYWCLREYSRAHEGLVAVIIDSYDKAKLSLPRWPFSRTPKKSLYEETRRSLANPVFFRSLLCTFWVCLSYNLSSFFQHSNATEELIWHSQLWFVMDGGAFCIWAVKHWQRDPTGTGNVFLDWIVLDSLPSSSFINVFWFLILPQSRWCDRWMKFLQVAQGKPFPYEQLDRVGSVMFPCCLLFFNMGEGWWE